MRRWSFSEFLELHYYIFFARKFGCFLVQQVHPYSNKVLRLTSLRDGGGGVVERGCSPPNIIIIECTLVIVTEYNDTFKYKVAIIYNQYINLRKIL